MICVLDMLMSPTKVDEAVKMPFVMWTLGSPMSHVLDGDPDLPIVLPVFDIFNVISEGAVL